jgi:hypothetical protein
MAPARFTEYGAPMNNKKHFLKTNKVGFVLGAVLLAMLTKNAAYADGLHIGIGLARRLRLLPKLWCLLQQQPAPICLFGRQRLGLGTGTERRLD